MTALALAVVMTLSPMAPIDAAIATTDAGCSGWTSKVTPPSHIRVLRADLHRVDRVPFKLWVERVMASGAFPAYLPMESLKAGAIAVAQMGWWHTLRPHHSGDRSGHRCMDLRDGGSDAYYRSDVRIHSRIRRAVDAVWGVTLRKSGRFFRPGWRAGSGRNGWWIHEDSVTARARDGWTWRRLIRWQLSPNLTIRP